MEQINFFNITQLETEPTAKLTWSKVEDCSYYIISRKTINEEEDYVQIGKTKKEVFFDRKLEFNKNYSYKLRAVFDVDFFELELSSQNQIKSDFKNFNFYKNGKKYSEIENQFPFNEMCFVDENKIKVNEYSKAKFLKIPKFYFYLDEENKKLSLSKTMINNNYDLYYSFIIDNELINNIYISLESFEFDTELKDNQFKMDISILNLIQTLYFVYFNELNNKPLINDFVEDCDVSNKPFNSDGINNYLFGLKNLFTEELFIDGILNKDSNIMLSINPLENNPEGFGYEIYDDFEIKNGLVTEYDLDFFMPLKVKKDKNMNLKNNGKFLFLDNGIFNYNFSNDFINKKIRIIEYDKC